MCHLKETPLVSIGMPVRNCQQTLRESLRSILLQDYKNWELILINDGSTDKTLDIAYNFIDPRIRIYTSTISFGLPYQLNQAIQLSNGRYFARMDGDDVAFPDRISRQVIFLNQHPDVDLVGSSVIVFGENGVPLGKRLVPEQHEIICTHYTSGFSMIHPTYMGKLDWFKTHCYDIRMIRAQDQDLLLRSYRSSCFANITDILLGYREEQLQLKKMLEGRRLFAQAAMREFGRQRRPLLVVKAVCQQVIKGGVDIVAVKSLLGYNLLRHRCRPLNEHEKKQWVYIWNKVHEIQ